MIDKIRPLRFASAGVSLALVLSLVAAESNKARPKGDVTRGKKTFVENCETCHDAYSKEEQAGPGLQGLKDGKLPDGRKATHDQLLDIINTGPAEMPSFQKTLSEQEKEDVVAFLMTL